MSSATSARVSSSSVNHCNNANSDLQNNINLLIDHNHHQQQQYHKTDLLSSSTSSITDYLVINNSLDYSLANTTITTSLSTAAMTLNTNQITLPRMINNSGIVNKANTARNHIITDTLPGPESCV